MRLEYMMISNETIISTNLIVNQIIEYINENYYDNDLSRKQIAQKIYADPSYSSRIFKKYTGESILTYIHQVRIQKANELLQEGKSIQLASDLVGYNNLNVFYKHFKRIYGMTPHMAQIKNAC